MHLNIQGQLHNRDKHTFSDPQYDKARSEVEEKVNLEEILKRNLCRGPLRAL